MLEIDDLTKIQIEIEIEKELRNDYTVIPKQRVPEFVVKYYENRKNNVSYVEFWRWFNPIEMPCLVRDWLENCSEKEKIEREYALRTIILYGPEAIEIQKEKKYKISLRVIDGVLAQHNESGLFSFNFDYDDYSDTYKYKFTKKELIEAGFKEVFNGDFKVEEIYDEEIS